MSILASPAPKTTKVLYSAVSSLDRAVNALRRKLIALNYAPTIAREITESVYRTKALADAIEAGLIDLEDVDTLTEVFVEAFDPVPLDSKRWDVAGVWVTAVDIVIDEPVAALPLPSEARLDRRPSPAEARAFAELDGRRDVRARPDFNDWQDYCRWSEWVEQAYESPYRIEAEAAEIGVTYR